MKSSKIKTSKLKSLRSQDPNSVRADKERNLQAAIGKEVLDFRRSNKITFKELSDQTGLSMGMLSKIENGVTSPSLTTLQLLANALGVPLTALFRRYEEDREAVHTKAGEGVEIVRQGTRAGHQYRLLGHIGANSSGVFTEPYLITLSRTSDVFPTFQHDGLEMLYLLEGQVKYRHGSKLYHLSPGDTLFFDADAPHSPKLLLQLPVKFCQ